MSKLDAVCIRNKEYGSIYRIIRTAAIRDDLYWVVRSVYSNGHEGNGTSRIAVDLWATGNWEIVPHPLLERVQAAERANHEREAERIRALFAAANGVAK